jgi:replicative DNA helicase
MVPYSSSPAKEPTPWLPHSVESEQALLGAVLVNNEVISLVQDFLKKDHFFEPLHGEIYGIAEQLIHMGKSVTPVTLLTFLQDGLIYENMTIRKYIARLAAEATTIVNAKDYALNIRDLALHRRIMDVGAEMQRSIPRDIIKFSSEVIDEIDAASQEVASHIERPVELGEAVTLAIEASAKAYQNNGAVLGLSWGWEDLDTKTLGLHAGDLIILAGRPGMGKTAIALGLARNLARGGHPGAIFSCEMNATSLAQRMVSDEMFDTAPIPYLNLRSGRYQEETFSRIVEAGKRLNELPVWIDPKGEATVSGIAAKARRRKRMGKLQWIVIDYLQLLKTGDRYNGNRVLEIGEITSSLKRLAKELEVPIVLLSQLNRQVESRDDKRPTMADLRESGNIEQDADLIVMLYREAYYLERSMPKNTRPDSEEFAGWQIKMNKVKNLLEIIVEKQRQGPIGSVPVFCNIACNAVRDLTKSDY